MKMLWRAPRTERDARVELAIAYRAAAEFGWTDLGATHFTARVPGENDAYLMLRAGVFFDEVTASNLMKVGLDGLVRDDDPNVLLNPAGVTIHSAIHDGSRAIGAVMHTHTQAGVAVANHPDGLLPLSQHALRFYERVNVHAYEGVALDKVEGPRLIEQLGSNELLLLANHGLLVAGPDVPAAFSALYYAEMACRMQVDTLATTSNPTMPDHSTCAHTVKQYDASGGYMYRDWMGLVRHVERTHSGFDE